MDETPVITIGDRLRSARRYRGMSQRMLADLSGLSQGFISLIENGERGLERRKDVVAIAKALRVSIADLTGQPLPPTDEQHSAAHAAVPDVRRTLMTSSLTCTDSELSRPVSQLVVDAYRATRIRVEDRDWVELGNTLPGLLTDTHAAALRAPERETALEALILTCANTQAFLKALGYTDLAWIAADRGYQASLIRDDPLWTAASQFYVASVLSALGGYREMGETAARAAEQAPRDTPEGLEIYGMLRLASAMAITSEGAGGADAALEEAADVAARTGQGDAFGLMFGPTNVKLWEIGLTLETGDPERAAELARHVDPEQIPLTERRATFHREHGLALARIRLDREAIQALLHAEQLDPHRLRNHPMVREAIAAMLRRARREAGGRELRGIAHRMGIAP